MASPYWIKYLINKTFSGRFTLSKLTRYPVIGRVVDYLLFDNDDIFYLPKDKVISINTPLDAPDSLMAPSHVVDHFIGQAGACWIMDFCICRDSAGCRDYPVDLGCIFLGRAAEDINPRFGRLVTAHEAIEHARRCREAGLVHLIGRNKLDTVWLNVGPQGRLLTICNCCPCCCLWKVLPVISPEISGKVSRMPGVSVRVTDDCVGCGTCTKEVCFVDAVRIEDKRAVIDTEVCRGCGRCAEACPTGAISVDIDRDDYIDAAIRRISAAVDVT